jgi:hypothetical protein
MAFGQQGDEGEADRLGFAQQHAGDIAFQRLDQAARVGLHSRLRIGPAVEAGDSRAARQLGASV